MLYVFVQVYSLTGRDIPRTVREKLRKQGPSVTPNVNIRNSDEGPADQPMAVQDSPRRPPLDAVFEQSVKTSSSQSGNSIARANLQLGVSKSLPRSSTPTDDGTISPARIGNTAAAKPKVHIGRTSSSSSTASSSSGVTTPVSPLTTPTRAKNSTIMARAAFWDSRITQGAASDKDAPNLAFPDMPDANFKR